MINLNGIGGVFSGLREMVTGEKITDPTKLAELDVALSKIQADLINGQMAINKVESEHRNIFVAGWRPYIGWVCGIALTYTFLLQPILEWGVSIFDITRDIDDGAGGFVSTLVIPPAINTNMLMELVLGMLGLAGLRTYEKIQDKA